jgi:polyhydroxybutyrate depolymerase
MMAYKLGCELSHRIAAIAPVAGALNVDRCSPEDPVSVIAIHGTADEHVLYEGGPPKKSLDPHPRVDRPVSYAISFWVKHNRCITEAQRTVEGNIVLEKYSNGRDGTEVFLYTINGGDHAWPGGRRTISWMDEPGQEISATDIIWEFFRDHPKR